MVEKGWSVGRRKRAGPNRKKGCCRGALWKERKVVSKLVPSWCRPRPKLQRYLSWAEVRDQRGQAHRALPGRGSSVAQPIHRRVARRVGSDGDRVVARGIAVDARGAVAAGWMESLRASFGCGRVQNQRALPRCRVCRVQIGHVVWRWVAWQPEWMPGRGVGWESGSGCWGFNCCCLLLQLRDRVLLLLFCCCERARESCRGSKRARIAVAAFLTLISSAGPRLFLIFSAIAAVLLVIVVPCSIDFFSI